MAATVMSRPPDIDEIILALTVRLLGRWDFAWHDLWTEGPGLKEMRGALQEIRWPMRLAGRLGVPRERRAKAARESGRASGGYRILTNVK